MNSLKPIVIAGPSGSGKDTLIKKIIEKYPNIHDALGYTTRPIREGEVAGREINFVTCEQFLSLIEENKLFEHSYFAGNYYGMPWEEVEKAYTRFTIFNVSVEAAKKLKEYDKDIITILIIPPTKEDLLFRMGDRGVDRYNRACNDIMLAMTFFDNLVINYNDQLEKAVFDIENIIFGGSKNYLISDSTDFLNNYFEEKSGKTYKKTRF